MTEETPTLQPDAARIFDSFWAPLVVRNGEIDMVLVKHELHDYAVQLDAVPRVYMAITNGRISKPHTLPDAVIECHNEVCPTTTIADLVEHATVEDLRIAARAVQAQSQVHAAPHLMRDVADRITDLADRIEEAKTTVDRWYGRN